MSRIIKKRQSPPGTTRAAGIDWTKSETREGTRWDGTLDKWTCYIVKQREGVYLWSVKTGNELYTGITNDIAFWQAADAAKTAILKFGANNVPAT